jgi:DNA methylase
MVALLASVRRASKATTQQGRLFKDIETALSDVVPLFLKKSADIINSISKLPYQNKSEIGVFQKSANSLVDKALKQKAKLIICHPPYFNLYKYSSINSLELSWMDGIDRSDIRKQEIREFFKIGKAENVEKYVEDMSETLIKLKNYLSEDGTLALMNGDTVMQNEYIPVNKMLMERLVNHYSIEKIALRIPKYTEASWAASQRRETDKVGISLCDFVYILKPLKIT